MRDAARRANALQTQRAEDKEIAFYRRMCGDLGRQLNVVQDERNRLLRDTRRYQVRDLLHHALLRLAARATDLPAFGVQVIEAVMELTLWSRGMVLSTDGSNRRRLTETASVGMPLDETSQSIELDHIPSFGYTADDLYHPADAAVSLKVFIELIGLRSVMWSFDPDVGIGLLLATTPGPPIGAFQEHDQDLADAALIGLVDGVSRLRSQPRLRADEDLGSDAKPRAKPRLDPAMRGIQEAELNERLGVGTLADREPDEEHTIEEVVLVEMADYGYLLFVSPSWGQGFRAVRKHRDLGDRVFKDLGRLQQHVRGVLRYRKQVRIYLADAPEVAELMVNSVDTRLVSKTRRPQLIVVEQ